MHHPLQGRDGDKERLRSVKSISVVAFDIGAGSGRAVVGAFDGSALSTREAHRFPNAPVHVPWGVYWDVLSLHTEILSTIRSLCTGHDIRSVGVDSWGADFGLIDGEGRLIDNVRNYRDPRSSTSYDALLRRIPESELFRMTGISPRRHFTLSRLYSLVFSSDPMLERAEGLLMVSDLLGYLLTGERTCEATIASTSQMLSVGGSDWNRELFSRLELPENLTLPLVAPGTDLGEVLPFGERPTSSKRTKVVSVAGHDTASAVTCIPGMDDETAFVSAGTTVVVGTETAREIVSDRVLAYGFKNCVGTDSRNLIMRDNTGFWILQQCKRIWDRSDPRTFVELEAEAERNADTTCVIDTEYPGFENPIEMPAAIVEFARRTKQSVPVSRADITRSILRSLVLQIAWALERLSEITGKRQRRICLLGGGGDSRLLSQDLADCTSLPVWTGIREATATGNVMLQLRVAGEIGTVEEIRNVVERSVEFHLYEPRIESRGRWDQHRHVYENLKGERHA